MSALFYATIRSPRTGSPGRAGCRATVSGLSSTRRDPGPAQLIGRAFQPKQVDAEPDKAGGGTATSTTLGWSRATWSLRISTLSVVCGDAGKEASAGATRVSCAGPADGCEPGWQVSRSAGTVDGVVMVVGRRFRD